MGLKRADKSKLKDVVQQQQESKSKNGDKRYLNYFDLKAGEKLTVRFLPDQETGEYWASSNSHGGNLNIRGLRKIACRRDHNEDCPVCDYSYGLYENGDDESKRWMRSEKFIAQCIVVDQPKGFEIVESEDGNNIKLVSLPWAVLLELRKNITEGLVEDPMDYDFVIKKEEKSGRANYKSSYFGRDEEPFTDEMLEEFGKEGMMLYDLMAELPETPSLQDVNEWLEKAQAKDLGHDEPQSSGGEEDNKKEKETTTTTQNKVSSASLKDKLSRNRKKD